MKHFKICVRLSNNSHLPHYLQVKISCDPFIKLLLIKLQVSYHLLNSSKPYTNILCLNRIIIAFGTIELKFFRTNKLIEDWDIELIRFKSFYCLDESAIKFAKLISAFSYSFYRTIKLSRNYEGIIKRNYSIVGFNL